MVVSFRELLQSCLAFTQSGACGTAGSVAQIHIIKAKEGSPNFFGVSPWEVTCVVQFGDVYRYV